LKGEHRPREKSKLHNRQEHEGERYLNNGKNHSAKKARIAASLSFVWDNNDRGV